jgi:MazG family protein
MQEPSALERIVELVRDLRKRCPWDAAQTPSSLRPYLVEEAMELDQALASDDPDRIKAELGDLLLHVAFQIVLAEEQKLFDAEDVTSAIEKKMWRRHPHLYDLGDAPDTWERSKLAEAAPADRCLLDGLPPSLPTLIAAMRLQERAAGVGFDWPDAVGPREKVAEELAELDEELAGERAAERIEHEIGDLLFATINLARKLNCDPRTALERANNRFIDRFRVMEQLARERSIDIGNVHLDALDALWDEAKRLGS